jgi:hypothetical protein
VANGGLINHIKNMRKTDKRTEENIKKLKLFLKNGINIKLHDQKRGHIQKGGLSNKY